MPEQFDIQETLRGYNPIPIPEGPTPEDLAEDAALAERGAFARKYLSRNLRKEADAEVEASLPKNRLLRALVGFGQGVDQYYNPKRISPRDKALQELQGEYAKQAPLLERDIVASESAQGKRQEALSKRQLDARRYNEDLRLRYADLLRKSGMDEATITKTLAEADLAVSRGKNLAANTEQTEAKTKFLQENGALPGAMSGAALQAQIGLKRPDIASAMDESALKQFLAKSALAQQKGSGGPRVSYSEQLMNTVLPDGSTGFTRVPKTTVSSSGGGPVASPEAVQNMLRSIFGGARAAIGAPQVGAAAPPQPNQPQNPAAAQPRAQGFTPRQATPMAAPQTAQTQPPPQPRNAPGAQTLQWEESEEARKARLARDYPGFTQTGRKAPTAAQNEYARTHMSAMDSVNNMLTILGTDDKAQRAYHAGIMNPKMGTPGVGGVFRWLADAKGANDPRYGIFQGFMSNLAKTDWSKALEMTGKAMSQSELNMLNAILPASTTDKKFTADSPQNAIQKLIRFKLAEEIMQWKLAEAAKLPGDELANLNKMSQYDFSGDIEEETQYLMSKWAKGKLKSEDVTARNLKKFKRLK